jgi:AcrR family transcriptional regulator
LSETRERILDAAANVVRERGLARATTKEIARAANLSEAALYRHFRNKEELFIYVLRERLPPFIAAMQDLSARVGHGPIAGTVEEIARSALAYYAEMVPMVGSLFSEPELLARHQETMRENNAGPQLALTALTAYLRAEQRIGRLPEAIDAEAASAQLLGACFQRAFIHRLLGTEVADRDEKRFARKMVSSLLQGV